MCEELLDLQGESYKLVGIVPARIELKQSLKVLGYREGEARQDNILLKEGEKIRGHEFRYSQMYPTIKLFPWAYDLNGRFGTRKEGFVRKNILASYFHVHFASYPEAGKKWIDTIKNC